MNFEEFLGKEKKVRFERLGFFIHKIKKFQIIATAIYIIAIGLLVFENAGFVPAIIVCLIGSIAMLGYTRWLGWSWYTMKIKGITISPSDLADATVDSALYSSLTTGGIGSGLIGILIGIVFVVTIGLILGFINLVRYEIEFFKLSKKFNKKIKE